VLNSESEQPIDLIAPMSNNTIPRPQQAPPALADEPLPSGSIPGSLLPLRSPPEPLRYPPLLCPPRHHLFTNSYTVTTHLIPAAFPRSSPFVPLPPFPARETKEERAARIQRFTGELLSLQAQHAPDQSGTQQPVLWSVLNRYVRKSIGGASGLTLLLLHANGLHKEVSVNNQSSFSNSLTMFRRLNQQFIIYYKLQTKMRNIRLMRSGLWTRYNMVTLDLSTRRASELYVCHPTFLYALHLD
jgi:hypothetical protein